MERPLRASGAAVSSQGRLTLALGVLSLAVQFGCSNDSSDATPGANGACPAPPVQIAITDETNYSFSSTLSIETSTLKDATDLNFDWSEVTIDFFGKPVDPAEDIDLVLISLFHLTPEELQDALNRDDLPRSANEGVITTYPDGSYTSQHLLGFGLLGNPLPDVDEIWKRFDTSHPEFEYPQDQYTFLLMAATGTSIGRGARMLSLFNLDPASEKTELSLTNDSTLLDYSVDLDRAEPVFVPAAEPSVIIDWDAMTLNALGNEYQRTQITEAVVAHFDTDSLDDLEADFLNLKDNASGWWSGTMVAGTSIDLETLTDAAGASFPGIDERGTWLVALFCTSACNNPAPWSITILEPCE